MLKSLISTGLAAVLLQSGAAQALPSPHAGEGSTIAVVGNGSAERTADYVEITGKVQADAHDQQAALKAMSDRRDDAEAKLLRLADVKQVRVDTDEIGFQTLRPAECTRDLSGDAAIPDSGRCTPVGVRAVVKLTIRIRPSDRVGAAASLATQFGLQEVQLGEWGVDDPKSLEAEVLRKAYADAQSQAELLASSSGRHLGRVVRLSRGVIEDLVRPPVAPRYADHAEKVSLLPPPPPPITPDVALKLTPPKVVQSDSVTVVFDLEP